MIVKKINLNKDWLDLIKQEIISLGYNISGLTDDKVSILYFSFIKKLIPQKPRTILKHNNFNCPSDLIVELKNLENKIINGENLKPHLTRKLKNLDYNDGLLYD